MSCTMLQEEKGKRQKLKLLLQNVEKVKEKQVELVTRLRQTKLYTIYVMGL